jgi:hypothetical protein
LNEENQGILDREIIYKEISGMKNWNMRVKTLRKILMHLHDFEDDRYDPPVDQETKLPKQNP